MRPSPCAASASSGLPVPARFGLRRALAHPGDVGIDLGHDGAKPGVVAQGLEIRIVGKIRAEAWPSRTPTGVNGFAQAGERLVALARKRKRLDIADTEAEKPEAWPTSPRSSGTRRVLSLHGHGPQARAERTRIRRRCRTQSRQNRAQHRAIVGTSARAKRVTQRISAAAEPGPHRCEGAEGARSRSCRLPLRASRDRRPGLLRAGAPVPVSLPRADARAEFASPPAPLAPSGPAPRAWRLLRALMKGPH